MGKRSRVPRSHKNIETFQVVNPNAAGIDAGSEDHWVAVPEGRADSPVRKFGTFTDDLEQLADWLVDCGITTVAIEATGVYWIPLYEVLEVRGLNPVLVDSRSLGRRNKKTDVADCQRIQQFHTYGLLDGAFVPDGLILPLRAFMRQRRMLIDYASDHIRHMQKALDLMNLKLHTVLSDITGVTGMAIIRAIVAGERDPVVLASMRNPKCKNPQDTIAKALTGNYREEHLFSLSQALDLFDQYQNKIAECDAKIADQIDRFPKHADCAELKSTRKAKARKNQPRFDGRALLYEMAGVDLVAIDGLDVSSVLSIISETGLDMTRWPRDAHFASWLNICPNPWITGGKPIRRGPPHPAPNRAAQAFRLAARTLERSDSALGAFFRRIKGRHGRAMAIKATAHKLARIFYAVLGTRTPYRDQGADYYEKKYHENLLKRLEKKAHSLGMKLVPVEAVH